MKITIDKPRLIRALDMARTFASTTSTMPIVGNVLLRVADRRLCIAATDLNSFVTVDMPVESDEQDGVTVSAKRLYDVVANLADDKVTLRRLNNYCVEVRGGRACFKLVALPVRDFPELPSVDGAHFTKTDPRIIATMISTIMHAIGDDSLRMHLCNALFEVDIRDGVRHYRMVATDGHRLAMAEEKLPGNPDFGKGIVVPAKALREMLRVLKLAGENCELGVRNSHMYVRVMLADDAICTVTIRLLDGPFVSYREVFPVRPTIVFEVARSELLASLKRARIVSDENLRFDLKGGKLSISGESEKHGSIIDNIDITEIASGSCVSWCLDARHIADAVAAVATEKVRFELVDALAPIVLRAVGALAPIMLVMPMRIGNPENATPNGVPSEPAE